MYGYIVHICGMHSFEHAWFVFNTSLGQAVQVLLGCVQPFAALPLHFSGYKHRLVRASATCCASPLIRNFATASSPIPHPLPRVQICYSVGGRVSHSQRLPKSLTSPFIETFHPVLRFSSTSKVRSIYHLSPLSSSTDRRKTFLIGKGRGDYC